MHSDLIGDEPFLLLIAMSLVSDQWSLFIYFLKALMIEKNNSDTY